MKEILLSEIPKYSPWPKRLLGITSWSTPIRDKSKVEKEYNQDTYGKYLQKLESNEKLTHCDIAFGGTDPDQEVCVSQGEHFYLTKQREFQKRYEEMVFKAISSHLEDAKTLLDLGCGYGYYLRQLSSRFPGLHLAGGEYSVNAVKLAKRLFNDKKVEIRHFDFYDKKCYDIIAELEAPILVLTMHAIEQLPSAKNMLDYLALYRKHIHAVIHFEPVCEVYSDSLAGLMRRRYVEVNDYNRDLLSVLQSRKDVKILDIQREILSINPFNPTTLMVWKFC